MNSRCAKYGRRLKTLAHQWLNTSTGRPGERHFFNIASSPEGVQEIPFGPTAAQKKSKPRPWAETRNRRRPAPAMRLIERD